MKNQLIFLVFFNILFHSHGFMTANPKKIIEITINPALPTNATNNQFADLPALLTTYTNLNFSEPTRMVIQIPPDTTIQMDQTYFNDTRNLEIVFQGLNRKTSILTFSTIGSLNAEQIDIALQNLTIKTFVLRESYLLTKPLISVSDGSMLIVDVDLNLTNLVQTECSLNKSTGNYVILNVKRNLLLKNVNGYLPGRLSLVSQSTSILNLTIENSVFNLTRTNQEFVYLATSERSNFAHLSNISLYIADSCRILHKVLLDYAIFNFATIRTMKVEGFRAYFGNNVDIYHIFSLKDTVSIHFKDVDFKFLGSNIIFNSIINIANINFDIHEPAVFSDINFEGTMQPFLPLSDKYSFLASENLPSVLFNLLHITNSELTIQRIKANNLILNDTAFLTIKLSTLEKVTIDSVGLYNSLTSSQIFQFDMKIASWNKCSFDLENQTSFILLNRFEIINSTINVDLDKTAIRLVTDCRTPSLNKLFMNTLNLTDWNFSNNIIQMKNPNDLQKRDFISTDGWNLIISNLTFVSNYFQGIHIVDLEGTQPIIQILNLKFTNNSLNISTFLRKEPDPTTFMCSISCDEEVFLSERINNYRYMWIKDSVFSNFSVANSALFRGDIINLFMETTTFEQITMSKASLLNLNYIPCQERFIPGFAITDFLESDVFFSKRQTFLSRFYGEPHISFNQNKFSAITVSESVFMNIDSLDYFKITKPFFSTIRFEQNDFNTITGFFQQRNNLLNIWCGGMIMIINNTFTAIMVDGMIFSLVNNECDSRIGGVLRGDGTIFINSNLIRGNLRDQAVISKLFNHTGFLELAAHSIGEFKFENNIISSCNTFNRGLVDISIRAGTAAYGDFSISRNRFEWNRLSIRNSLKANFFSFQYLASLESSPFIHFSKNTFVSNIIEGDSIFTDSLLSLIPSLIQFEALRCYIFFDNINFFGNTYTLNGFLATITASKFAFIDSQINGNQFREINRTDSSNNYLMGKQGLLFLGSRDIFINNVEFVSNRITKGSFIALDNSWYNSTHPTYGTKEDFAISITNCELYRNSIKKGAVAFFSGESFPINLKIENTSISTRGNSMNYIVQAKNLKGFKMSFRHSIVELYSREKNENSNLFSFENIKTPQTNGSVSGEDNFPVVIENCSFYFEELYPTSPPKIEIINMNTTASSFSVLFKSSEFLPLFRSDGDFSSRVKFEVVNSKVVLENCTFKGLNVTNTELFYLKDQAAARFENSVFQGNLFLNSKLVLLADSVLDFIRVTIAGNNFTVTAIHIAIVEPFGSSTIVDSNFSGNILGKQTFLIFKSDSIDEYAVDSLTIDNTIFENNALVSDASCVCNVGGGVVVRSSQFINNTVQDLNASSKTSPALENIENGTASIVNCTFRNNKGTLGGVIRTSENVLIENSSFIGNIASVGAGAIFFVPDMTPYAKAKLLNNLMTGNKAPTGNDFVGPPFRLDYEIVEVGQAPGITLILKKHNDSNGDDISSDNATIIANFTPGAYFNHILKIYAYDQFGNRLDQELFGYFSDASLKISRANSTQIPDSEIKAYYYNTTEYWQNGTLRINGSQLRLVASFGTYVIFSITARLHGISLHLNLAAQADSRCLRGDIYDSQSMTCQSCKSGWYSLNPLDTTCYPCPAKADCISGEDKVSIEAGYWANLSGTQISPIKCTNNKGACLGGFESECKTGYTGPTCEDCAYFSYQRTGKYYSKAGSFECEECPSVTWSYIRTILSFAGTIVFEALFVLININYNEKHIKRVSENQEIEENHTGAYVRMLVSFLQILGIIEAFNFQLPGFINTLYSIDSPTDTFFYTSQCLIITIMDKGDLGKVVSFPYLMTLIAAAMIVFKLLFTAAIWLLLKTFYKERIKPRSLFIAFISIFYLELPSLLDHIYGIISCKQIDGKSVLASFPSFDCSTPEQLFFAYRFAIPIIVLVVGILPLILLLVILRERKQSRSSSLIRNYEAFTIEFKSRYFYWVFVILFFKFALITLSNVFPNSTDMDMKIKALGLILVFALYLAGITYLQPYTSTKIFDMDRYLTYTNITTIFFSYLSIDSNADEVPKVIYVICFSIILMINLLFLVYSIVMIYKPNSTEIQGLLKKIAQCASINRTIPEEESEEESSESKNGDRIDSQSLNQALLEGGNRRDTRHKSVKVSMEELKPINDKKY